MSKTQTLYSNNARTTLSSDITSSSISFTVGDASTFPTISSAGQSFYVTLYDTVNIEVVLVTSVTGNTLTVTRAQDGTTAHAFAAASPTIVSHRLTAASLNAFARLSDRIDNISNITSLADPTTMNSNSYICASTGVDGMPILAISATGAGIWKFANYQAIAASGSVGSGSTTTSINMTNAGTILSDTATNAYILQLVSGGQIGTCRFVTGSGGTVSWTGAMSAAPSSSDTYQIYRYVGGNVYADLVKVGQAYDPVYASNLNNVAVGSKQITAGDVKMWSGTAWNSYALNYIPVGTTPTFGSYTISGNHGNWAGFSFSNSYNTQQLLVSDSGQSSRISGIYNGSGSTWDWQWTNGTLTSGVVPYSMLSGTPDLTVYAPKASPALTGVPTAPTASLGTATSQLATTQFVSSAINNTYVYTGNYQSGSETNVSSGIKRQWTEATFTSAGNTSQTISYPTAFSTSVGTPRVSATNLSATNPAVNNFVGVTVTSFGLSSCVVFIGSVPTGTGTVTVTLEVRGV